MAWEENLRIAIEGKFLSEFNYFDESQIDLGANSDFTPPVDGSPWCRITHTILNNVNAQLGHGFQRAIGIITVQCFTKVKTGEKVSNEILGAVGEVFQNKDFSGVSCKTLTPVRVGTVNNWYQMNAKIDFTYDVFS
jgi:hypothetical protein